MDDVPKTIRIGTVDYIVTVVSGLMDGDVNLNGHIVYNQSEIRVEQDMTPLMKYIIIWHEVIHGILEQAGIDEHDENVVVALAYGIANVLRCNEWLRNRP